MGLDSIHSYLIERMIAVAEEIFDNVRDKIIEYETEIDRLNQENCLLRSRDCRCNVTETCHDTLRDQVLQGPTRSKISQMQMKVEVASVLSVDSLSQSPSVNEDVQRQDPELCLSFLPDEMEKAGGGGALTRSVTVKSELCDYQTFESSSSANNCEGDLPVPEQFHQTESATIKKKQSTVNRRHQNVTCYICNKSCRDKARLQKHMLVHQDVRPFSCRLCGSRFKSKSNLKEHERVHVGDYRYSCPRCGRGFSRSNHVRTHLNSSRCR